LILLEHQLTSFSEMTADAATRPGGRVAALRDEVTARLRDGFRKETACAMGRCRTAEEARIVVRTPLPRKRPNKRLGLPKVERLISSVAVAAVMGQALAQVGLEETRATWESDATPPIRASQHDISALEKFPQRSPSIVNYPLRNNRLCVAS
jgi:hypothetical protein